MQHDIMNNELLRITVNPEKQRTYCSMRGFWKQDVEREKQLPDLLQQLLRQIPPNGTVMLDTTKLRLMHPRVAELFLPAFTRCLRENNTRALAHVGNSGNTVLKLQFERVLGRVEKANEICHKIFQEPDEAEHWLDKH